MHFLNSVYNVYMCMCVRIQECVKVEHRKKMREEVEISMRGRPGLTGSGNIEAVLYIYGHTTRLVVYKR